MAYIHIKKIRGKKYYTLRISERRGNKIITKDLCNLGDDLSKIKLDDLEKKYKNEIRKSHKTLKNFLERNIYLEKANILKVKKNTYFSKEQQLEINAILIHYKSKFMKLNKLTQREVFENFILNFAVNSTSIEGNTINLKEANELFEKDKIPKDRTLREVYDLKNTKETILFLKEKSPKIDENIIIKLHDMLLENIDNRLGFRTHEIKIFGQPFKPSPVMYIRADIKILISWYNKNKTKLNPLVLATLFHHKFEKIHPFSDGNGRTGRILMNHILDLEGYPPTIITKRFRNEYISAINSADKTLTDSLINMDPEGYKDLIDFSVLEFRGSYWDIFLV
ncbi:Fic family protein [Candidatus Pacearchaeota archaeon]|nr:Fic family protein [Candidatus Pacearchaeota archaeon]